VLQAHPSVTAEFDTGAEPNGNARLDWLSFELHASIHGPEAAKGGNLNVVMRFTGPAGGD
jgi:hypothetical protein